MGNTEEEVGRLEVRVAVLEKQHETFERASIEFMSKATREEGSIHARLDDIVAEVHKIPEMVSNKLTSCRVEMREEIGESYAKKHEVVTPRALIVALGLAASIFVVGISGTFLLYNAVQQTAQSHHVDD